MANPTTRDEFKEYCLRKLGKPVIEINVSDDQVDDRLDESLKYYWDYHFDGSDKVYYKQQVTDVDKANKYITLPPNIIGAVSVFPVGDMAMRAGDLFNIRYQIALNDLYTLTSVSMVPYYMTMQNLGLIQEMLVGKMPIRYNRHKNLLYIDTDWNSIQAGEYLLVEAYEVIDPVTYSAVWNDRWLQNYVTAKIKYQWGSNITKFNNVPLPGGMIFNGDKILDDAKAEIEEMEHEMIHNFSMPPLDMIG